MIFTRIQPPLPELKAAIPTWLDNWKFSRFVTLAFNDASAGDARMPGSQLQGGFLRDRLRMWDGRINHAILGRYWAERHGDRTFAFYTVEKVGSNPHWHGLVRFFSEDPDEVHRQEQIFDAEAATLWKKLVPSGTTDVQVVDNQLGVANYIAKTLAYPLYFESYIVPDEFQRG